MTPVLLDFESRSRADLTVVGGRRYWQHPSTEAIVVAWFDVETQAIGVWYPGQDWPHHGRVHAAHNAIGFDRYGAARYGFDAPEWIDTMALARKAGLPGSLDALGSRLLGIPKDSEGSKLTRSLSAPQRPTHAMVKHGLARRYISAQDWAVMSDEDKHQYGYTPQLTPAVLARVTDYCLSDVYILAAAWPELEPWLPVDRDVEMTDREINDRGICFDRALAGRLLDEDARIGSETVATVSAQMPGVDVRAAAMSPKQFTEITGLPNAQKSTVAACDHPLAVARQSLASIAAGKLATGLALVSGDGRLRDSLAYYGAHTGRWAGRGFQPQNLPRPARRFEEDGIDVDALAAEVLAGRACAQDEIGFLLRGVLTASPGHRLIAADFSSIEARGLAWASEDKLALKVFRSGQDPYRVAATAIYRCTYDEVDGARRQIGKVAELALGYQGGPGAFEAMAKNYAVDTSALDLPAIVRAWRALHAPVTWLWMACQKAFRRAFLGGKASPAGPFVFQRSDDDRDVACILPSGRPIVYCDVEIKGKRSIEYLSPKGRKQMYGGKLVENAIQAMCRDLMAAALVKAEHEGLRPVLTSHDEIVCDVPEATAQRDYARLVALMTDTPSWAYGMPVGAKGWVGFRYRK